MRNSTKFWLFSSAVLVIAGTTIFTTTACAVGWDFSKFSTTTLETNTYTLHEDFNNITIDVDTADLTLRPSENEDCKVVCHEDVKQKHSVIVENGTLTIQENDERAWYDYISTGINDISVTVYLPKTQYTALSIETHTGDIEIPQRFTFDSVDISGSTCDVDFSANVVNDLTVKVSTGDTTLTNVTCKNLTHHSNTGALDMKNVLVSEKMHIEKTTGDVKFERCDAGEIYIKTDTGDVKGSLLSGKNFQADSDTGDVKTPTSTEGGKCEIHSSTGDIHITVAND